jgi:hypothetical protein
MPKILALDIATKTGWAYRVNGKIISGVEDFSLKRGDSPGMRYIYFGKWLSNFASQEDLLIVYEQPNHRGGAATEVLVGLVTHMQSFCAPRGFEHAAVEISVLKKHATGKGNAGKEMMIDAANVLLEAQGIDPTESDDEADAICLLNYAEKELII